MADFIRREDALKVLCNNYAYAAMDVIKRLPAADVAEVVRCKYCRHLGAPPFWRMLRLQKIYAAVLQT